MGKLKQKAVMNSVVSKKDYLTELFVFLYKQKQSKQKMQHRNLSNTYPFHNEYFIISGF
jgi:hypothetical protein